jgi:hypothetical protein
MLQEQLEKFTQTFDVWCGIAMGMPIGMLIAVFVFFKF